MYVCMYCKYNIWILEASSSAMAMTKQLLILNCFYFIFILISLDFLSFIQQQFRYSCYYSHYYLLFHNVIYLLVYIVY